MNRMAPAVLSTLLALLAVGACSSPAKVAPHKTGPSLEQGKAQAPVAVDVQFGESSARVTLRFESPATAVQVDVHGVDGLVVKSASTPISGSSFTQGSETTFDVAFTPGAGRSHLVVSVTGLFNGAQLARVASFAVGTPTLEQQRAPGNVTTGSDGERIKALPSSDAQ